MSASILVVDDEPDVADLFRQRFRREARQGTYVMHFAASAAEALDRLAGESQPALVAVLSDINMPGRRCGLPAGAFRSRRAPFGGAAGRGRRLESVAVIFQVLK